MCQVAAVRAEVAFSSVMLTAAVPAQAEWNGNDIMFIQERRSQAQISVSKILGCKERTLARDHQSVGLLSCCTHDASSHKHLTHQREPRMLHLLHSLHGDFHIHHTPHTHTNMSLTPHTYTSYIYTQFIPHPLTFNTQGLPHTPHPLHKHISTQALYLTHTHHTQQHSTQHISSHLPLDLHILCLSPIPHTQSPPQIQTHESTISHNTPLHKCTV